MSVTGQDIVNKEIFEIVDAWGFPAVLEALAKSADKILNDNSDDVVMQQLRSKLSVLEKWVNDKGL